MKLWLFGSYKWQGNPKALVMYMAEHSAKTHEVWWVADSEQDAALVSSLGYHAVVSNSKKARGLFSNADVYITENFREKYPAEMNPDIKIINLWHGVGLKHIELALGAESALAESIVRKYVRNFELYKNNLKFLATSKAMEDHFIEDMPLDESQIIRGGYPRNQVYQFENMRTDNGALDFIEKYDDVYLFAPTYRFTNVNGSFKKLLPNLGAVAQKMADSNSLFIIKLHPFMLEDPEYLAALEEYEDDENVYFWDDKYDVYEIFNKITVGVVDYSSIFYDMLESGVERFIRYIPDYDQYVNDLELVGDYFELTDGVDAYSFAEFIDLLGSNLPVITKKADLLNHFFEYDAGSSVDTLIEKIDNAVLNKKEYKTLHTFDIFDTLIRRNTVEPEGIFYL
ncbi:CDP-glycerol glycerophosphotransferase family protein, partial [Weissella sp. DD23]|uniref:CDP-glycerol glycerophosphotransferase family protein n=1 Tax=Weissella sp. DD23 TaxID=1777865 RepID=UPI0018D30995